LGLEKAGVALSMDASAFLGAIDGSINPDGTGSAIFVASAFDNPIEVGARLFYGNGSEKIIVELLQQRCLWIHKPVMKQLFFQD